MVGAAPAAAPAVPPWLLRLREHVPEAEPPPASSRTFRRKPLLVGAGLLVLVVGVFLPPIVAGNDPEHSTQQEAFPDANSALRHPNPPAKTGIGAVSPTRTTEPRIGKAAFQRVTPTPAAGSGARLQKQGAAATHLFTWLRSHRARYYHVRFFRGARIVFEAWPTEPRVLVPVRGTFRGKRFAFTNGRYRWIVRPGLGPRSKPRYGEPIVRSVWIVP
jgi:hypothetical protein